MKLASAKQSESDVTCDVDNNDTISNKVLQRPLENKTFESQAVVDQTRSSRWSIKNLFFSILIRSRWLR